MLPHLRTVMKKAFLFCFLLALTSLAAAAEFTRIEDVVYARKFGTALTLDVFQPEKQNGCGIIFMVSGGFFSSAKDSPDVQCSSGMPGFL